MSRFQQDAPRSYWRLETGAWGALRIPSFRLYAASRIASGSAQHLGQAIVLWQVYAQSGSVVDLGIVGLVRLVPSLMTSLVSGAVADALEIRIVMQLSQAVPLVATLGMLAGLYIGHGEVPLLAIYALVFATGVANSFEAPARQVLLRAVVPDRLFSRAIVLNSTLQSFATTLGPAVAGALIAWGGVGVAYLGYAILVLTAIVVLIPMRLVGSRSPPRGILEFGSILEGLSYVRGHRLLRGVMLLDLFAVIFGGARALLPVYAVDVLQVGAAGYGILSATLRAGSLVAAFALTLLPVPVHTGRVLLVSFCMYGVSTILFGLSTWLPVSLLWYAVVGASDRVSAVMRLNTIQLGTPDALRGRVSAVSQVFSGGAEQLGAMESGFVAALTNVVFAVVSGGAACLAVVGTIAWRVPELRHHRRKV